MPSPGPLREKPRGTLEPVGARRLPWSPLQPPGQDPHPWTYLAASLPHPTTSAALTPRGPAGRVGLVPCGLGDQGLAASFLVLVPSRSRWEGRTALGRPPVCQGLGCGLAHPPAWPRVWWFLAVCVCVEGVGSRKGSAAGRCVNTNQQDRAPRPLGGLQPPTRFPTPHRARP